LSVTADAQTKVYGEADPALTYQLTSGSLFGSDTFSGALTRVAGENAGVYAIQQGSLSAGTNYILTFVPANLSITKKDLLAQADDQSRVYGQTNPLFTITYSGFIAGDDINKLLQLPTATTTAATTSAPGDYPITLTGGADTNYAFHLVNGTLTVTPPGEVTISNVRLLNNHLYVEGQGDPNVTYSLQASSDLVHWQDIGTTTTDTSGSFEFQDPDPASLALRFYRTSLP
jgi:hypothetical protein